MKSKDNRCEEHGMYLYRTGFGWSCKLGCYYTDDPQKIKDGFIRQYKEELKNKIKKLNYSLDIRDKMPYKQKVYLEEVLELIK